MANNKAADPHANRLLGLLRQGITASSRIFDTVRWSTGSRFIVHTPDWICLFHQTGVGSLVNTMVNGQAAEVGTIGNEGMVGLPLVFGDDRAPTSVYVQVPGAGLKMKATLFESELARALRCESSCSAMRAPLQPGRPVRRMQSLSSGAAVLPWLLMTHDSMQSDEFLLTQELPAMMLGVRRTGVTGAAGALQRAGLIRY